jgi:hypothetical protein
MTEELSIYVTWIAPYIDDGEVGQWADQCILPDDLAFLAEKYDLMVFRRKDQICVRIDKQGRRFRQGDC